MIELVLQTTMVLLGLSTVACLYRVVRGPSISDRVVALDSIGINLISITAVFSVWLHDQSFIDVILLIGIIAFVGTIAFSRFIERGTVIERTRQNR